MTRYSVPFCLLLLALSRHCFASDPPPNYVNRAETVESNLLTVLATDRASYPLGEEVKLFLSVENVGEDTVRISSYVSPMNAFFIMPDSCTALDQPGCRDSTVYQYPGFLYFFGGVMALAPGQCVSWVDSWNGQVWNYDTESWELPAPGMYSVLAGLFNHAGVEQTAVVDFLIPDSGLLLQILLNGPPVIVEPKTWGNLKSRYIESR